VTWVLLHVYRKVPMNQLNAWVVFAMLSPVLLFMLLYSVVVLVALLRADVKDVPDVLEVASKVYEAIAGQLHKIAARTAQVLRAAEGDQVEATGQQVQPQATDIEEGL
jgi:hypothetical protein